MRRLAWGILAAGIALRVASVLWMDVWEDAGEYAAMGHALATRGDLVLPFGEDRMPGGSDGEPLASWHYPPAWPAVLAAGYKLLGFGLWQTRLVALVVSLGSLAVVYACTRDLLGDRAALLTTALVSVEHQLVWVTGRGYSENLVLVFFTLTLWAILRSLREPRFIVLGGLFAGLAYLTRASMGPFFLVAGVAGLAWRWKHRGWRGVADGSYLAAAAVFLAIVVAWAARNAAVHGWPHLETSPHLSAATAHALSNPGPLAIGLAAKALLFAAFLAVYALPLMRELRGAASARREEATSALLLAAGLVFALGWLLTALLWTYEGFTPFFLENQRYVVVALVPLAWLAVPRMRDGRGFAALAVLLLVASAATLVAPMRDPEVRAAELVLPNLEPGDEVGIAWFSLYSLYPHLAEASPRLVPVARIDERQPAWVVSVVAAPPEGYVLVWEVHQRALLRGDHVAWVFARADVAAVRGLAAGEVVRFG